MFYLEFEKKISLLEKHKDDIESAVYKFRGSGVDPEILRAKAENILFNSADKFNPDSSSFRTHLFNNLKGLYREVNNMQNIVRIPENRKLKKDKFLFSLKDSYQDGTENSIMSNSPLSSEPTKEDVMNKLVKARTFLTEREKEVFDRLYGFNGSAAMENKDIMKQLGMSKSRFSEIRKSMSNKIIPIYEKLR